MGDTTNLDPQSVELAPGIDLHLLVGIRIEVGRVGIELLEHSPDGTPDQLLLVYGFDVVVANQAQHIAEEAQVLVTGGGEAARARGGDPQQGGCEGTREKAEEEAEFQPTHGAEWFSCGQDPLRGVGRGGHRDPIWNPFLFSAIRRLSLTHR
jgi:hypothetical protein